MTAACADILEKAAWIIETHGWCQRANARDSNNHACRVTHPDAMTFSLYGAVLKAMGGDDKRLQHSEPMWRVLTDVARAACPQYHGVHPVMEINDLDGQTQEAIIRCLKAAASVLRDLKAPKKEET